jgi:type VI protein secretion system component Hcp
VTFVDSGVTEPELAVKSYSWGATNPTGGTTPSLQDLTLTLAPSTVEAGLWGHLAAGTPLGLATIHVRTPAGSPAVLTEYLRYTLTNVFISSFATSAGGSGAASPDTIQLHFGEVAESYFPINANGTPGTPNTADYNQATATSKGAGSLAGPAPAATPSVGVTFVEGGVTRNEIMVSSYSWGATNPTAGKTPTLQDFTLTVPAGTLTAGGVEPGLWGHLAAGTHLDSATIHVRMNIGNPAVFTEYITYTLTNVFISSFTNTEDGSGAVPKDTIQLHFDKVAETYLPFNRDGTVAGFTNNANYNQVTGVGQANASLGLFVSAHPQPDTNPLSVIFQVGALNPGEVALSSYSWGGTNSTGTAAGAKLQDFTMTVKPDAPNDDSEPALWSFLALAGQPAQTRRIFYADVIVRTPNPSDPSGNYATVLDYNFHLDTISSFTTTEDGSGAPPLETFKLRFQEVNEGFNGNSADYNVPWSQSHGAGSLAGPAPAATPAVGVTFVDGGVTEPELPVQSYSWGAANSTGTATGAKLQDLTLTVPGGTLTAGGVDSGLWGHMAAGTQLGSATIHVRTPAGNPSVLTEYITYTLTNVFISSLTTTEVSAAGGAVPVDTIQLHFGEVKEAYSPINANGSLGSANTADYNQATGTSVAAGSLAGPVLPAPPPVGLTFVENGVTLPELAVKSYSWGATNPTGGTTPSLQDMTLTLAPSLVEAGLWGHLAAGTPLGSATIHVRTTVAGKGVEYITYTLTNVFISGFLTTEDGSGGPPLDTIQLHFGEIKEDYFPISLLDGTLGLDNSADYDLAHRTSRGAGKL